MMTIRKIAQRIALIAAVAALPSAGFAAAGAIGVSGNTLLRDGKPWIPKGVVLVGRVAPAANTLRGPYAIARASFGVQELNDISRYGADLVRFQVSQSGLDPKAEIYSPAYVDEVVKAIKLARSHGFAVIVSMQSERPSGADTPSGLPTDSTVRAWTLLAPRLASDPGVMLELFNEPSRTRGSGASGRNPGWGEWHASTQPVLDAIRRAGAHNVVIADGLNFAHTLAGVPELSDPDRKLIYGVHPAPQLLRFHTAAEWDAAFGEFARSHAVLATEWNIANTRICIPDAPKIAADFLAYAAAHRIGVVGWAYDYPGTLKNTDNTLTTFTNFDCASGKRFAAGDLLHRDFIK